MFSELGWSCSNFCFWELLFNQIHTIAVYDFDGLFFNLRCTKFIVIGLGFMFMPHTPLMEELTALHKNHECEK